MANEIEKSADAALAENVLRAYASGLDRLTDQECAELGIDSGRCEVLKGVLRWGPLAEVTPEERQRLHDAGFAKEFIRSLAGVDGMKALRARAKWITDHAIPDIILALGDNNDAVRFKASMALGEIGHAAIPLLKEALEHEDAKVRVTAAGVLTRVEPNAEGVLPVLIQALGCGDKDAREKAAMSLKNIGSAAVPDLLVELGNEGTCVCMRINAAWVLGLIGPDAKYAVPYLTSALVDDDDKLRQYAAWALGRIGPGAEHAVSSLGRALKDKVPKVREHVAEALGEIGVEDGQAIKALEHMANSDRYWSCRLAADLALVKLRGY